MLVDVITIIISSLALLLSLANTIYILICNHKRINIIISSYTKNIVNEKYVYIFDLILENKSRLAIAISSLKIMKDKEEFTFNVNPKLISEITSRTGKEITGESSLYSSSFPINIMGLSSNRVFLELSADENIEGECNINLISNRGKTKKKINIDNSYMDPKVFMKEYKDLVKSKKY